MSDSTKFEGRTPCDKLLEDPTWQPYCLVCSTMGRMTVKPYGFKCEGVGDHFSRAGCGNRIGVDMHRYTGPEA